MPEVPDFVRLSLVTKRQDVINFVEAMCSDEMELTIVSAFSELNTSKTTLLLIDASLFNDFNPESLEYGKKYSSFSIFILPPDLSTHVLNYVETNFNYSLSFPINTDYFRAYCFHVINLVESSEKGYNFEKPLNQPVPASFDGLFAGNSNVMQKIRRQILEASCTKEPVLLLGETGTGKTTAAGLIHELSDRGGKEKVAVSVSTIVESLAESAFFGHKKGAFTNADYDHKGHFETADKNSLFVDELGLASLSLQSIFLTFLDTGNFKRIGENIERHADVRMIFATNANLGKMLKNGTFLDALFYRICDHIIRIPPLRSHKEDIREMVRVYLGDDIKITDEAMNRLEAYNWPGNVRELNKCLRDAVKNCNGSLITTDSIEFYDISFPQ